MIPKRVFLLTASAPFLAPLAALRAAEAHLGMGVRVGEVTQTSAIVWTRISAQSEPNWKGTPPEPTMSRTRVMVKNVPIPPEQYEGAMPGAPGRVRVFWGTKP